MGGSIFIVFVDDAAFAYAAARSLAAVGMRTVLASGFATLPEAFENDAFDVVITDIKLSGGNHGLALAQMIRDIRPRAPIILLTTYPEEVVTLPGSATCDPSELAALCCEIRARQA